MPIEKLFVNTKDLPTAQEKGIILALSRHFYGNILTDMSDVPNTAT